ncbi:bifunctional aspartate kinase/homoserine dehydrogenase II [Ferrimonas marina]|uniref:Bifunctional aspartokinase/homoserine dehydrogenase n=1 Tax=Ferrimonas marina TaxID=299255 RepID=A0A1M5XZ15_9GAMM|nr:bifunctional aspartate kinase/homoserine dehydrogenase II [Ferrimonas marina]SHI04929.1 aspartate kinase [Ferrimonas marina]
MPRRFLHKFGGSSLADADCYRRVAHILLTQGSSDDLVVVSAAGKTTNQLIALLQRAESQRGYEAELQQLEQFQQALILKLLLGPEAGALKTQLCADLVQLRQWLAKPQPPRAQIQALGEVWSARLLAALLGQLGVQALALDARRFLTVQDDLTPDYQRSADALAQTLASHPDTRVVITGFVASNSDGDSVLLGRNGSDYSATVIAALAGVAQATIWTDVQGVFNADPNLLQDARLQAELSLEEADRLARLGSPVLHSRTLQPLKRQPMALHVRSSYTPEQPYTKILDQGARAEPVITSLDRVVVLKLPVASLAAAQSLLAEHGLLPLLQYPDKGALVLTEEQAPQAESLLSEQLTPEFERVEGLGMVALVSRHAGRLAGAFARLLGRRAWPLQSDAMALITLVPEQEVADLTARAHRRCAGPLKKIGLLVAGKGNIGAAWLTQFAHYQRRISDELEAELSLVAILGRSQALLQPEGIDCAQWQSQFEQQAQPYQLDALIEQAASLPYDELIFLDITASGELARAYPQLLSHGVHLISANKQAGSDQMDNYRELKNKLAQRHLYWRYNATVGAGLPVFYAIDDLQRGGDTLSRIEGVFSGTLSWLFHHFDGSKPFSQLVLEAKAKGFTEPDPREDLGGVDMQRKLLILAREAGLELELEQIGLESLVPDSLAALSPDEFLERIDELDGVMKDALASAQARGLCLRYTAALTLAEGKLNAKVGLEPVAPDHPFASLPPGDNQFLFYSEHYPNGLVIQGPGAGREVTAAAVQSDLVAICRRLLH